MSLQSNVETITEQTQLFQSLAIILMVVAIAFFIAAIIIFIVFKIPHSFRVLTGVGLNKEINKAASGERNRQKAALTWGTSGALTKRVDDDATSLLVEDETIILCNDDATTVLDSVAGSEETTILGGGSFSEETTVLDSFSGNDETTVLDSLSENDETTVLSGAENIFQMEDDIKITGSNKNI